MMFARQYSYLSPKIEARESAGGAGPGMYAVAPIAKDELLLVWSGKIVDFETLQTLPEEIQRHSVQVEEGFYLASFTENEAADYINHSCEPNAGLKGQLSMFAMRDIAPGEQVCFDYATSDGTPYDEFECACGAPTCRGNVTGDDWRNPVLWEKYAGYFMPYIQRRIDKLHAASE